MDDDAAWNERERGETRIERLDRNWSELLQEVRVVQTGVQFLTGFLLTLPFAQRFTMLGSAQRAVYIADVGLAAAATGLLIAPVSMHRLLFRRHEKAELVKVADRLAIAGIALLGLATTGVVGLIGDVVYGVVGGAVTGGLTGLGYIGLWFVLPAMLRGDHPDG